jgi:hypothetical protein
MNLWIYADETTLKRGTPPAETAGYGVLLTSTPIGPVVVDEALTALEAGNDRHNPKWKKQDDTTLANGYFHGTDDSQNAHSHFCTSIRKHVTGQFTYVFEDPTASKAASLPDMYTQALRIALVELCYWPGPINLLIEQRGSLTASTVQNVILDLLSRHGGTSSRSSRSSVLLPQGQHTDRQQKRCAAPSCRFSTLVVCPRPLQRRKRRLGS